MRIAPGFESRSVVTRLGTVAYAAPQPELWPPVADPDAMLIFLHGFGGGSSSYEWSKVYPAFATDCRVIAPDLPGWGRSEHPERDYQISDYLDAIAQCLALSGSQSAIVVASSLTAAMAVRVAIESPELVKALILVAPSGLLDFGQDTRQAWLTQVLQLPWVDQLLYNTAIATPAGIRQFLETRQFANPQRIAPEIVDAYLASAQQPRAERAALAFVRGELSFDLAEFMPRLTVPTAILWGQASQFTSPDVGRQLADLNPAAVRHFEVIENVGLTPQLEQPALTTALIRKCLQRLQ